MRLYPLNFIEKILIGLVRGAAPICEVILYKQTKLMKWQRLYIFLFLVASLGSRKEKYARPGKTF